MAVNMGLEFKASNKNVPKWNFPLGFVFAVIAIYFSFCVHESIAGNVKQRPKIFGKMEIRSLTNTVPQWVRVMERNKIDPLLVENAKINNTTWAVLKNKWKDLPIKEKLKKVNTFWNKWRYKHDINAYKVVDYWAIPKEFYANSGDCEDYAIIKYYTLVKLGVPKEDMRVAVVKETIRNIAHAVLVVYVDDDAYVLDNLSNQVLSHSVYKHYDIQFSINEFYKWSHFKAKK